MIPVLKMRLIMIESSTVKYTICALFVAFISICSQIAIYIGPVPISMSLFAIFMASLLLGMKYGTISVIVYILLGITGIPVFAGARGGFAIILGPTGGFLIGYILCALIVGFVSSRFINKKIYMGIGMIISVIVCYIPGILWHYIITGNTIFMSLKLCVIPFIPGDVIKIIISLILYSKISKRLNSIIKA